VAAWRARGNQHGENGVSAKLRQYGSKTSKRQKMAWHRGMAASKYQSSENKQSNISSSVSNIGHRKSMQRQNGENQYRSIVAIIGMAS